MDYVITIENLVQLRAISRRRLELLHAVNSSNPADIAIEKIAIERINYIIAYCHFLRSKQG